MRSNRATLSWSAAALLLAAGCAPALDARARFDDTVLPVLEAGCAATMCHGVPPDAEARGQHVDWQQLFLRVDERGALADPAQAYEAARRRINTVEDPAFSSLLRKPLAVAAGGVGHLGGSNFGGTDDAGYAAIREWIAMEHGGGEDPAPLDERERLYADTVQPVLVEATCMTSRCHGPDAGSIPYRLDVGVQGRFPIAATRHNYQETLRVLSLDGWPGQSRVVKKALPLGAGVLHKGLNFDFFAGNPGGGVAAIERWACEERRARTGRECADDDELPMSGFVFVRGPIEARDAFDLRGFTPGSDLMLARVDDASLMPSSIENLTAPLHPEGEADVKEPSVSRDGTRVVFAMRTRADQGHHLWMIELATGEARQLTSGNGPLPGGGLATDRDPTFGPDDTVWFASTRAGVLADQGRLLDAELYSLELATLAVRRWTHTPHVERKPVFFDVGGEAGGEVAFSVLRDAIPAQARAHIFRFPPDLETEYHQHFGITPLQTFHYDMVELPDGRYVDVVGDLPAPWQAGALAVVDRNFGPEINERAASMTPALERYLPPMTVIASDGAYRDPAPLVDGRLLVAHHPAPFDVNDPAASLQPRLELVEIEERADGSGPAVARVTVLVDEDGVALSEPAPIAVRAPVRVDGPPLADGAEPTAVFRHQGLAIIDGLLANLPPSGMKTPLAGIAWVRLVEHLPQTPTERAPVLAGEEQGQHEGATTASLGRHGPSRILAELPVEADGSFQARVPAGVAFRVQALDASRMAIGHPHNRWFSALPGQVLTQGISTAGGLGRYGARCASCHGEPSGAQVLPPMEAPDAITGASLSLARYQGQDPRLPIEPLDVGLATRVEVDFARDVQPILDARCVQCHGGEQPAGSIDLSSTPTQHFTRSYEALLAPGEGSSGGRALVDDDAGRARASFLIELLTGRELDAPRALRRMRAPPPDLMPGAHRLSDDELLTLVRWIELGATFRGLGVEGTAP
ncbi:MAG: hypothetical protein A2138_02235 [Deltaproteobacteria bacterium RBG_16_71_12]|nr:MAG: hypothetical protein A2138_02235 [Deltaproteobacteria bacterium RBG_16_71_12]